MEIHLQVMFLFHDLFIYLRVCSATVFGVSTESMQLSYDSRGNCVPTILTLLQSRLYDQGGLQVEGIFRITGDNSEEEFIREELNKGVLPEGIDIHCLAGLIKAWFRELPRGVLDPLPSQQVMQCESEEDFVKVVRLLPQTEASLLNWAINLMADFVEFEDVNKMTSRNLALVFAPNMSQMADPLTALMYAVQVMNLLKNLIDKTLRERKIASSHVDPCDNRSEAEDGDVEEYNQEEEMYNSEEDEDEDADEKDKDDEIIEESGNITPLADEHIPSSEVNANDQKKQET
ncbi:PREDICTED: rho GTPase-activating protein 5-like [Camelina sativa]|uniref:Rho GTPase-activating protein 5-like n=1 Tax=Camelina sativa TaxID=90675 RepID=A0ABM1QA19_CAMSA|nr:PREDICTED: rho GTPase-activating protein 5-like [Camelina sativa]